MLSHHQIVSRRMLLGIAGVAVLSSGSCGPSAGDRSTATPSGPPPAGTRSPAAVPGPPPATHQARPTVDPLFELGASDRVVALTLDDGPHPTHTPEVLELLHQHGIQATFFLIGENAAQHPDLVRAIAGAGHHVANHTWTHPDLRHLPDSRVRSELERTSDLLQQTTGKPVAWFRAPGGDWSDVALRTCAELGMRPMGWSVDPRDWACPGTEAITSRVLEGIRPGAIVLNHDGGGDRSQTIAALRGYLPVLLGEGYRFTTPR
ncbi:polysaccharide deacetylase family protein [Kitasatospora cystarginea]|uniref:Polysaccharide deacetylase family protein n=1 Tax=Kitasatospora cystarginea TaxID=58350 RepID=A0ABN3DCQ1_9ACTN